MHHNRCLTAVVLGWRIAFDGSSCLGLTPEGTSEHLSMTKIACVACRRKLYGLTRCPIAGGFVFFGVCGS